MLNDAKKKNNKVKKNEKYSRVVTKDIKRRSNTLDGKKSFHTVVAYNQIFKGCESIQLFYNGLVEPIRVEV